MRGTQAKWRQHDFPESALQVVSLFWPHASERHRTFPKSDLSLDWPSVWRQWPFARLCWANPKASAHIFRAWHPPPPITWFLKCTSNIAVVINGLWGCMESWDFITIFFLSQSSPFLRKFFTESSLLGHLYTIWFWSYIIFFFSFRKIW